MRQFATGQIAIPPSTAWYLSDLGEFLGKQELYTRQSPQRLKPLREHAMIESAVSSNRIEGISINPGRVRDILVAPKPLFRDRDEEEVRGYRDARAWIHAEAPTIPIEEQAIKRLHAMTRGQIWDAGQYKEKDGDAKTDQVLSAIKQFTGEFSVAQLEMRCPGVGRDMVRRVLCGRQAAGEIECQGRGPAAEWRKKG